MPPGIHNTLPAHQHLGRAQLYVLVDGERTVTAFRDLTTSLVAAGVQMLQLRDKSLSDRELLGRARVLRQVAEGRGTLFIMNDRPDLARLAGADGVHLGQDDLPPEDARAILGADAIVGVSTHTLEQAQQAFAEGASYIGCGPTFPSGTKAFRTFAGVNFLKQVSREIRLPAFAIGGISLENLGEVHEAGFCHVALSGAITRAADPAARAREMLSWLVDKQACRTGTKEPRL